MFACEYSDSSEVQYDLLKNPSIQTIDPSEMPETKEAKGLDAKRQWYLYDQIRPFCASTLQADFTCPKPTIPRPTSDTTTLHVPAEIPSVSTQPEATPMGSEKIIKKQICHGKKPRKCTNCGVCGHNKRSCPSK